MATVAHHPARNGRRRRSCPRCASEIDRVNRHWLDRFMSLWQPVLRFRCRSIACGWEGALLRRYRAAPAPGGIATEQPLPR